MTAIKNRKGRKRKSGRRTASGRLVVPTVDYRASVGNQPHRNWLPESLRGHERAADVLGCLNLTKLISDHAYEAGRRFSVIVGAFRQAIGAPRGTAGGGRGYACEPSACALDPDSCICKRRTVNYSDACGYLQSAGQKAYNITYQVVISEMIPESSQMADLTQGLAALERGFGLSREGRARG